MELVALVLAIYRKPLFILLGVLLAIAFIRENPWLAALIIGAPIAVLTALIAVRRWASKSTDGTNGPGSCGLWHLGRRQYSRCCAGDCGVFQLGPEARQVGTITKLARVMLLAPLVLTMALNARGMATSGSALGGIRFPWGP